MRDGFKNIHIACKNLSDRERDEIRAQLEHWAQQHVAPLLPGEKVDAARLSATVIHHPKGRHAYSVNLRMNLPRKRLLVAKGEENDLQAALTQAENRLLERIRQYMARLRQEAEYKRKARRMRLRELKARITELPDSLRKQAEIESILPRLERVVRRELAYLRYSGDLAGDYPTVQDVMDEAVAAVLIQSRDGATDDILLNRLLREAFKVLDREVAVSRRQGEVVSLDERPDQDAEDQAEAMVEEEIYEYFQPDDVLQLSDVLPDETAELPESESEAAQQMFSLEILGQLPVLWRRVLMLSDFEQLAMADIAVILEVEPVHVDKWRDLAEAYIHEHLRQAGFSVLDNG